MSKRVDRAQLRGKPLDTDCLLAHRSHHEYGLQDKRIFCYGIIRPWSDEYLEKCKICGAFVDNAEPLKKEQEE